MSLPLKSLQSLIEQLGFLPSVGLKTAQRLSLHLLKSSDERINDLCKALKLLKTNIARCDECGILLEKGDGCFVCEDPERSQKVICVVEEAFDVFLIESSGLFQGRYHVLGGVICPEKGIYPENLNFSPLFKKVKEGDLNELIMALDADFEGDLTSLYLQEELKDSGVKLTRIAQGVPYGGDLDYIDTRTLAKALENRTAL